MHESRYGGTALLGNLMDLKVPILVLVCVLSCGARVYDCQTPSLCRTLALDVLQGFQQSVSALQPEVNTRMFTACIIDLYNKV